MAEWQKYHNAPLIETLQRLAMKISCKPLTVDEWWLQSPTLFSKIWFITRRCIASGINFPVSTFTFTFTYFILVYDFQFELREA